MAMLSAMVMGCAALQPPAARPAPDAPAPTPPPAIAPSTPHVLSASVPAGPDIRMDSTCKTLQGYPDEFECTWKVANPTQDWELSALSVEVELPPDVEYIGSSPTADALGQTTALKWSIDTVGPQEEQTFTARLRTLHRNVDLEARADYRWERAGATTRAASVEFYRADLESRIQGPGPVSVGDEITYVIYLEPEGGTATGVRVVATLPEDELEYVSDDHGGVADGNKVRWSFARIIPPEIIEIRVQARPLKIGEIKFEAEVNHDGSTISEINQEVTRVTN